MFKKRAKVTNGLAISYLGEFLTAINENDKRIVMEEGTIITINIDPENNKLFTFINNKKYLLKQINGQVFVDAAFSDLEKQKLRFEKEKLINKKKNQAIHKMLEEKTLLLNNLIKKAERLAIIKS